MFSVGAKVKLGDSSSNMVYQVMLQNSMYTKLLPLGSERTEEPEITVMSSTKLEPHIDTEKQGVSSEYGTLSTEATENRPFYDDVGKVWWAVIFIAAALVYMVLTS
jgi:hypothetical protein